MKILIVEDENLLGETVTSYLKNEGYQCEWVDTLEKAHQKSWDYEYDCLVVDIGLPDGEGFDVIKQLKEMRSNCGIIIVSAKHSLDDRIYGLEIGADDYLTKPFDLVELNARIKSILRRRNFNAQNTIVFNEIEVFPDNKEVRVHNELLKLTKKEYDMLVYFLSNLHRVITRTSLAEHLWGDQVDLADSYDFIYTHLKNLRKKIINKKGNDYIQTIYGVGYKFTDETN